MILIKIKKCNTNLKENNKNSCNVNKNNIVRHIELFKDILQNYSNMINFPNLECPHCHCRDFIRWGFYIRGIIYFIDKQLNSIRSETIKIQRVKCKKCKKTHALLPIGIIPYKQITAELMNDIILNIINTSIEKTVDKFSFNYSHIKKIWKDFKSRHLSRLATLVKSRDLQKLIQSISESLDLQVQYIIRYNCCFMQIKLGCLGI